MTIDTWQSDGQHSQAQRLPVMLTSSWSRAFIDKQGTAIVDLDEPGQTLDLAKKRVRSWPKLDDPWYVAVAEDSNGTQLAVADRAKLHVWDRVSDREVSYPFPPESIPLAISPDLRNVAIFDENSTTLYDAVNQRVARQYAERAFAAAFSNDGTLLALSDSADRAIRVYDLRSNQLVADIPVRGPYRPSWVLPTALLAALVVVRWFMRRRSTTHSLRPPDVGEMTVLRPV